MFSLLEELKKIFLFEKYNIDEFGKIFSVNFKTRTLPESNELEKIIKLIPDRDEVEIKIINPDEKEYVVTKTKNEIKKCEIDSEDNDDFNVKVEIVKNIENSHLSIYDWECFAQKLNDKNIIDVLKVFNNLFCEQKLLYFEIFDKEIYWNTKTMILSNKNDIVMNYNIDREYTLKKIIETTNFNCDSSIRLIAEDFIIQNDYSDNPLTSLFYKISTLLSISYLSNQTILSNNELYCNICGQRNLEFKINLDKIKTNYELIKIYEWVYSNEHYVDKAMISRNVISLHCKLCNLLDIDERTLSSIMSNYNIYLKGNVDKFLEAKENVATFICNITSQITDNVSIMFSSFKTNIFAVFSFVITTIIANQISSQPLDSIFTEDIIIILINILFLSIIYLLSCIIEIICKMKKDKKSYDNLKEIYNDIFSEDDFNVLFKGDKKIKNAQKSVTIGIVIWTLIWLCAIAIPLIILFQF